MTKTRPSPPDSLIVKDIPYSYCNSYSKIVLSFARHRSKDFVKSKLFMRDRAVILFGC